MTKLVAVAAAALALVGLTPSRLHAGTATADAAPVEALSVKVPAEPLKLFALVYRSEDGVVGDVRINDVPVVTFAGKGNSGSSNEIQTWLLSGANQVEIRLTKLPGAGAPELAAVSLHGLAAPGFPDESNALWSLSLKRDKAKVGTTRYAFELPAKHAPPSQLWKATAVMASLSEADKKEIDTLVATLFRGMQRGEVATLKKLMSWEMEERARSTYSDPKELLAMIDQMAPQMKTTFGKAKLASPLSYTLQGGGRFVAVTAKDGKAPIIAHETDGDAELSVRCAKIDGHFTLVP